MTARQIRRRFLHPVRETRRILQERYATDVTVLLQKILDLGGQEIPSGTWKITSTLHVSSGLSGVIIRLDTDDPTMAATSFAPRNLEDPPEAERRDAPAWVSGPASDITVEGLTTPDGLLRFPGGPVILRPGDTLTINRKTATTTL